MKRAEWQKFHGFTDEDIEKIDCVKKMFNGTIVEVFTGNEYKEHIARIKRDNLVNIDKVFDIQ